MYQPRVNLEIHLSDLPQDLYNETSQLRRKPYLASTSSHTRRHLCFSHSAQVVLLPVIPHNRKQCRLKVTHLKMFV